MTKRETFTWRVDTELKRELEAAARADGTSISDILERVARAWIAKRRAIPELTDEQRQAVLAEIIGSIDDAAPPVESATNAVVRRTVVEVLERRYGKGDVD
jgi:antitoxin component of RelBE/YafQ-DinJ toxin-antitoxin module